MIFCYDTNLSGEVKEEFELEVERWIEEGILVHCGRNVSTGVIPLMAVVQSTKNKVRPGLNLSRELN